MSAKNVRTWDRATDVARKAPLRGALVIGAASETRTRRASARRPEGGRGRQGAGTSRSVRVPICARQNESRSTMPTPPIWRTSAANALKAFEANQAAVWKALRAQGIFRGHGTPRPKWHSSTPGRARSTSTCSRRFAQPNRSWPRRLPKPIAS